MPRCWLVHIYGVQELRSWGWGSRWGRGFAVDQQEGKTFVLTLATIGELLWIAGRADVVGFALLSLLGRF